MISIAAPIVAEEEIDAVNDVLKSRRLAQGPLVAELEDGFAKACGTKYAVALNSGTAALHTALYALGVGPGDEVITVPFSFIATVNSILMAGAKPVFVDIDNDTFNLDVALLEAAITPRTRAIIPVHLFGQPCDMDEITRVAKRHGLKVVEDACQAVGATFQERPTGSLGDIGCFSLYATKNIMCGEGGVLTTDDDRVVALAKQFRQHGMTAQYEYVDLGFNYRMSDLHAAVAVAQLKKLDAFSSSRQANAKALGAGLGQLRGLVTPTTAHGRTHVFHQYTIRITPNFPLDRTAVTAGLKERGVGSGIYYPKGLHLAAHIKKKFGYQEGDFPVTEAATREVLALPVHPHVSDVDVKSIVRAFEEMSNE